MEHVENAQHRETLVRETSRIRGRKLSRRTLLALADQIFFAVPFLLDQFPALGIVSGPDGRVLFRGVALDPSSSAFVKSALDTFRKFEERKQAAGIQEKSDESNPLIRACVEKLFVLFAVVQQHSGAADPIADWIVGLGKTVFNGAPSARNSAAYFQIFTATLRHSLEVGSELPPFDIAGKTTLAELLAADECSVSVLRPI